MKRFPVPKLIKLTSVEQIPSSFASEEEEATFWDTHSISDELWEQLEPAEPLFFEVGLDEDLAPRLGALARRRGVAGEDLARRFVAERLYEEEKREGIIGDTRAS